MHKVLVNCATGEVAEVPLTPEEQAAYDAALQEQEQQANTAEQTPKTDDT